MVYRFGLALTGAALSTLGVFVSSTASAADAGKKPLSEPALFSRCYAQVTGKPVPLNHYLGMNVREGKIGAVDACLSVLEKGKLAADGTLALPNDPEAIAVLNQFYSFNKSLMPVNTQEQLPHYSVEYAFGTSDMYDMTEPALAMTKVMFGNHKYRDLITTMPSVRAIRREDQEIKGLHGFTVNAPLRRMYGNNPNIDSNMFAFRGYAANHDGNGTTSARIQAPMIQMGTLVGIRNSTDSVVSNNFSPQPFSQQRADQIPNMVANYDILAPAGGGVLGYPIYMMSYFGHQDGIYMDGGLKVPRAWAVQSLKTFLCATMPQLRASDVGQYLDTKSSIPFRAQSSCLGCHATQDQMAYTARNYAIAFTDFAGINDGSAVKMTTLLPHFNVVSESVQGWPSEKTPNFHVQSPKGRFYHRSVTGAMYDVPVNNIAGLGAAMADTDDFYQCAAKRYFEMMTGHKTPLFDRGNAINADLLKSLSPDQVADRRFIEQLGEQLKSDQSAYNMIKSIITSDYFRSPSFRP